MLSIDSDKYFALNTGSTNENLGGRALGVHVCGGVGMAFIALKISPSIHNFISKQQSAVYSKLQTEVDSLANSIKRGKICFIKNEDLNQ
jgi:hypothetical protein